MGGKLDPVCKAALSPQSQPLGVSRTKACQASEPVGVQPASNQGEHQTPSGLPLLANNGPDPLPGAAAPFQPSLQDQQWQTLCELQGQQVGGGRFDGVCSLDQCPALGLQKTFLGFSSHPIGFHVALKTHGKVS